MRTRVHVLYTGGTFGMRGEPLKPVARAALRERLHGLGDPEAIAWELEALTDEEGREVAPLDSSAVTPAHWLRIAAAIERRYHEYDGFVVVHGTDTMAYTASALSFLLVNLAKPVVLTGSQLPIFSPRSDAQQNLMNALLIAGWKATGLPLVPEVTVCFGDALLRGNRTRKVSATAWQGFASPNYPALGRIGQSIRILPELVRPAPGPEAAFYAERRMVDEVLDITLFPGLKPVQLATLLERAELRGVILRAYGAGNAPADHGLLEVIGRCAQAGKAFLVVTQCNEGRVDLGRYEASRGLQERGVASGFDMTPEAALTKLMWVLAREGGDAVRAQLQQDQRGEQSLSQRELHFGPAGKKSEPVERVEATAQGLAPEIQRLERATLTVRGLGLGGARLGELRFFLNATGIAPDTPTSDVRCLGCLQVQPGSATLDVTDGARRLLADDRPVHVTVLAEAGLRLWYRDLQLDLLIS